MGSIKGAKITGGITIGTNLICADNSGAKLVRVFGVKKGSTKKRRACAGIGDIVRVSVKAGVPALKKTKVLAVIIRQKRPYRRYATNTRIKFEDNSAILIKEDGSAVGSIVKGVLPRQVLFMNQNLAVPGAKIV